MRVVGGPFGGSNLWSAPASGSKGLDGSLTIKASDQVRPPSVLYLANTSSRKRPAALVRPRRLSYQATTRLPNGSMAAVGKSWKLLLRAPGASTGPASTVDTVHVRP